MPLTAAYSPPDRQMRTDVDAGSTQAGTMLAGGLGRYLLALIYAFALCYAYHVLSLWWDYFGFTYRLTNDVLLYGACIVAATPALLLVARPTTFAQAAGWFVYALIFLPCLLVPVMQFSDDLGRLAQVFGATLSGCFAFLALVRGDVRRIKAPVIPSQLFWGALFALWLAMLVMVVVSFGAQFQFVGVDDIYNQRFDAAEAATNPVVRYSIALLGSAIDPFLVAAGLHTRRYWIAGAGALAQITLYGTLAAKAVLLSPLFVIGAYFLRDGHSAMRGRLLLVGLIGVFVLTLPLLMRYDPLGGSINQFVSLLYMRTLLIAGATYGVYEQFFSLFPLTYYSNNSLVSLFVTYPYGTLSVGQTVQQFLIPSSAFELGELNANFLATDGMAALGIVGVPLASVVGAFALRIMSRFVAEERTMLMVAGGTGFMLALANTSLLTSLVTGGGLLFCALVFLAPLDRD
ncbi:putative membrane protein [Sphingomonas sp. EC-HK361]|uniref:hypothetical protein n=1 Tax=Sphingomonas sp. EC-HK361 TaxID=2038397 RepID=UPI00125AAEA8|nr:hypothetical protein [Sphingomonas sp. EC-HK361]VVS98442.1 putative membrane protein [Sphingomonas sp. EC-HK361]